MYTSFCSYFIDTPATICFDFWSILFLDIFGTEGWFLCNIMFLPWIPYPRRYLHPPLVSGDELPVDRLLLLSPATLLIIAITSYLMWWRLSGGGPFHPNSINPIYLERWRILSASQLRCLLHHWLCRQIIIINCFPRRSLCDCRLFAVAVLIRRWIVSWYLTGFPLSSIIATTGSLRCWHCSGSVSLRTTPIDHVLFSSHRRQIKGVS